ARSAIASPLLEASIEGARGILLNISGGSDLGLFEVNEAAEVIHGVAHPDANIIFGAVIDDEMGDEVRGTVIAAGFDRWETGTDADAAVPRVPGVKLAGGTADCVPVVLVADDAIGVVHAGWRGLAGGILQKTIAELGSVGRAYLGPHIRVGCYEFGVADLDEV